MSKYKYPVCRGCWQLGNNCKTCERCIVHNPGFAGLTKGKKMEQKPSVGRIVHYMAHGSKDGTYPSTARAAIIVELTDHEATVKVMVCNPTGIHFNTATYGTDGSPATWCYPPRV